MREVRADVTVIGGGPAGLAAACAAAGEGRRVAVLDDNPAPGGQIWRRARDERAAPAARAWMAKAERLGVAFHAPAAVFQADGPTRLYAEAEDGALAVDTGRLVLATGASELMLPFPGWTLPGVVGAGGLQALAKSGFDVAGRRVLIAGTGPLTWAVAAFLRRAGAVLVGLAEQATRHRTARLSLSLARWPRKLVQAARVRAALAGVPVMYETWPQRAEGGERLERVVLAGRHAATIGCDFLACGFGLVPDIGLAAHLGCRIEHGAVAVDDRQETGVPGVLAAGESTGIGGVDLALVEGRIAGLAAAGAAIPQADLRARRRERAFARQLAAAFSLSRDLKSLARDDTIVCRCEDVSWGEVLRYAGAREAKLSTRCGMGPCQGRVCGPAVAFLTGWAPDRVRPPLRPVSLATLADLGESMT